jgi:tRNA threonylcarbamoyladenosine biosynthesis protein TsaE
LVAQAASVSGCRNGTYGGMPDASDTEFSIELTARGETGTAAIAAAVASVSTAGDVIALSGVLGSGKTVFARGFIRALTGPDEEVPSPTFTLVQIYPSDAGSIHHFDLYRLKDAEEAWELGIEDAFADGISLIEWPERLGTLLPPARLEVVMAADDDGDPEFRRLGLRGGLSWRDRLATLDRDVKGQDEARDD